MWWNLPVMDEQALLIAIPLRHLEAALETPASVSSCRRVGRGTSTRPRPVHPSW